MVNMRIFNKLNTLYEYMNVYTYEDRGVKKYCIGILYSSENAGTVFYYITVNRKDIGKLSKELNKLVLRNRAEDDKEHELLYVIYNFVFLTGHGVTVRDAHGYAEYSSFCVIDETRLRT